MLSGRAELCWAASARSGHCLGSRSLRVAQSKWTTLPAPRAICSLTGWREVSGVLVSALDGVSEEALAQPVKQGPPSADGKISGVVKFLAIHETYHVGQASYLRGWLGHKGLMG